MQLKVDISFEEQETLINYSKFQIGEWAEVYTTDKVVMKRYEKFASAHSDFCRLLKEDKYSMTFSVHPKCASLYPRAPRKGRELSEEEKQAMRERLDKIRNT